MGIILGLTAALCWGTADFMAGYAARQIGTYRALLFMQFIGLAGLSIYLFASGEMARLMQSVAVGVWGWALLGAGLNIVSSLALYRSFEVGVMSIVSPIAASYAALTVILAILSGETLSPLRAVGIVAALLGVLLASTSLRAAEAELVKRRGKLPPGVGLALVAALGFGVGFWMLGFLIIPQLGGVAPVWVSRLTTVLVLPLIARPIGQSIALPRGAVWWLILGVGIFDTAAFVANTIGLTTDQVAVVSVIASLFSAVTVLLAWVFLRERLAWNQWLGIGIIFVGVALVSVRTG